MSSKPGSVYKSFETDAEFLARVRDRHPWFQAYSWGSSLDDLVWDRLKVQRKIIERTTER